MTRLNMAAVALSAASLFCWGGCEVAGNRQTPSTSRSNEPPFLLVYLTLGYPGPGQWTFVYAAVWTNGRVIHLKKASANFGTRPYEEGKIELPELGPLRQSLHRLGFDQTMRNQHGGLEAPGVHVRVMEGDKAIEHVHSQPIDAASAVAQLMDELDDVHVNQPRELPPGELSAKEFIGGQSPMLR